MTRIALLILCTAFSVHAESLTLVRQPGQAEIKRAEIIQPVAVPVISAKSLFTPDEDHFNSCEILPSSQVVVRALTYVPGADWKQTVQPIKDGAVYDVTGLNFYARFQPKQPVMADISVVVEELETGEGVERFWSYSSSHGAVEWTQPPDVYAPGWRTTYQPVYDGYNVSSWVVNTKVWRFLMVAGSGPAGADVYQMVSASDQPSYLRSFHEPVLGETYSNQSALTVPDLMTYQDELANMYQPVSDTNETFTENPTEYRRWEFTVRYPVSELYPVPVSVGTAMQPGANLLVSMTAADTAKLSGVSGSLVLNGPGVLISLPLEAYPSVTRP